MSRFSKIFLLLLVIINISSIQSQLKAEKKNPIELKIGKEMQYDKNANYFQFNFAGSNSSRILLAFAQYIEDDIYLTDPQDDTKKLKSSNGRLFAVKLNMNGTYYLEFKCISILCDIGGIFKAIIPEIQESIDLNEKVYSNNFRINSNNYYGDIKYKVSKQNKNKIVFFISFDN